MVGATGFEPATSWPQTKRSTRLSYAPLQGGMITETSPTASFHPGDFSAQSVFKLHNSARSRFLCAVSKFKLFSKFWLPVILWAALIFSASGDKKSAQHSSRIIEPLVRWLIPGISDEAVGITVLFVRKCAHVTEFAIFTILLMRAARETVWKQSVGWSWKAALFAVVGSVLFAISDEVHQSFVPGRQAAAFHLAGRIRKKW
jgi:VanZ family protein